MLQATNVNKLHFIFSDFSVDLTSDQIDDLLEAPIDGFGASPAVGDQELQRKLSSIISFLENGGLDSSTTPVPATVPAAAAVSTTMAHITPAATPITTTESHITLATQIPPAPAQMRDATCQTLVAGGLPAELSCLTCWAPKNLNEALKGSSVSKTRQDMVKRLRQARWEARKANDRVQQLEDEKREWVCIPVIFHLLL